MSITGRPGKRGTECLRFSREVTTDDGQPAVIRNWHAQGKSLHFATMPGLAHGRGAQQVNRIPTTDGPSRITALITNLATKRGHCRTSDDEPAFGRISPVEIRSPAGSDSAEPG